MAVPQNRKMVVSEAPLTICSLVRVRQDFPFPFMLQRGLIRCVCAYASKVQAQTRFEESDLP